MLSPQLLQQHEADAKAYDKNNKFKKFIIDSYKDAHEGLANVVNKKNPFESDKQEVDENEMINEIAGEREEEMLEEQREEKKPAAKSKPPSKKRFGQKDGEDVGFIPPPNDLGLESPGELGKPVTLPANLTADVKKMVDDGWLKNAFNQYVSDLISVRRSLPDPRTKYCKDVENDYLKALPDTSVIVTFHNEAWTTLLRTVHSILDRSPDSLIREVILVDDFSDMPHVQKQLEDYMENFPKVKIIRAKKREGLIRARLLGAVHAKAPVLTFLDSHIECTTGWLEPLLDRIARNTTTVVCPVIDVIDDTTLQYHYHDSSGVQVGGFDWNLQFNWHPVPESERKRHKDASEPVWSPTMVTRWFYLTGNFNISFIVISRLEDYFQLTRSSSRGWECTIQVSFTVLVLNSPFHKLFILPDFDIWLVEAYIWRKTVASYVLSLSGVVKTWSYRLRLGCAEVRDTTLRSVWLD